MPAEPVGMSHEEAEAMASRILEKAPHLDVQVVPCVEIFGEPDDGTWCCEMVVPGEPRPTEITRLYARVIENAHQWEITQEWWNIIDQLWAQAPQKAG